MRIKNQKINLKLRKIYMSTKVPSKIGEETKYRRLG